MIQRIMNHAKAGCLATTKWVLNPDTKMAPGGVLDILASFPSISVLGTAPFPG